MMQRIVLDKADGAKLEKALMEGARRNDIVERHETIRGARGRPMGSFSELARKMTGDFEVIGLNPVTRQEERVGAGKNGDWIVARARVNYTVNGRGEIGNGPYGLDVSGPSVSVMVLSKEKFPESVKQLEEIRRKTPG